MRQLYCYAAPIVMFANGLFGVIHFTVGHPIWGSFNTLMAVILYVQILNDLKKVNIK